MKLLHFIRLLRPINLAVIVLTMYVLRYFLLAPVMSSQGLELPTDNFDFGLLVFATLLIAGAGNIINDYFDLRTDRINKPHRLIVGRHIKRRWAMASHFLFSTVAALIGIYLSWHMRSFAIIFFFVVAISLLWSYSIRLKRQFLIGNLVIALLSGIVPLLVGFFEIPAVMAKVGYDPRKVFGLVEHPPSADDLLFIRAWVWILAYAGFAFLSTLVREIQKDIADVKGDRAIKASTLPIFLGVKQSKYIVMILVLIMVSILIWLQKSFRPDAFSFFYLLLAVSLPAIVGAVITMRASKRATHLLASNCIKMSMAAAVCYVIFL